MQQMPSEQCGSSAAVSRKMKMRDVNLKKIPMKEVNFRSRVSDIRLPQ